MTKKVIKALMLLAVITSCEEIENKGYEPLLTDVKEKALYHNGQGWDYVASLQDIELTIANADLTAYNLQVRQTIHLAKEGADISEAGFKVVGGNAEETIEPATITRGSGGDLVAAATLRCNYDGYYSITPFFGIEQLRVYGEESSFRRTLEEMKPDLNKMFYDLEMSVNAHTITASIETEEIVDNMEFTFAGVSKKAIKSGNRFAADFDLNNLEPGGMEGREYKDIGLVATNMFGQTIANIPYSVRVVPYQDLFYNKRNPADGVKTDYITIGGVNWAKGNLICKNGAWGIDNDPFSHAVNQQDNALVQYFSYGSTDADPNKFVDLATADKLPEQISGDTRYDVVATHLKGWHMPTNEESMTLVMSTSMQICKSGIVLYPIGNADKYFFSNTQVTLKKVPADGLYLPNGGVYSARSNGSSVWSNLYPALGAYMSDSQFIYNYLGTKIRDIQGMYFYNPSPNNNSLMNYWYLFDAEYKGYGSYDMGTKSDLSLTWKYYVRPVYGN